MNSQYFNDQSNKKSSIRTMPNFHWEGKTFSEHEIDFYVDRYLSSLIPVTTETNRWERVREALAHLGFVNFNNTYMVPKDNSLYTLKTQSFKFQYIFTVQAFDGQLLKNYTRIFWTNFDYTSNRSRSAFTRTLCDNGHILYEFKYIMNASTPSAFFEGLRDVLPKF